MTITEMVKELTAQPISKDTVDLFPERTRTLVHRISEKCSSTNSPVEEYIWNMRAEDLMLCLARESSRCMPEIYVEALARLIVPVIEKKLEWEEDSERILSELKQENQTIDMETDLEDGLEFL